MSLANRLRCHAIKAGLRVSFKFPGRLPLPVQALRQGMELGSRLLPLRSEVSIEQLTLGGVPVERITPPGQPSKRLLHLHGGAYMVGSAASHRALASELAMRANAEVLLPDYRLAPEHAWPAAADDVRAVYQAMHQVSSPLPLLLGGDSAGAALALDMTIDWRDNTQPLPQALYLFSPWLDASVDSAWVASRRWRDPMLSDRVLKRGASAYRGQRTDGDAHLSPLYANLEQLPPLLIQVGSEEILLGDALQLEARYRKAGNQVTCQLYQGMWHDFQLFSAFVTQADDALDEVALFAEQQAGERRRAS